MGPAFKEECGRAQAMAHMNLPVGQAFSAPAALWGPTGITTFKISQERPRRSSPAKSPLCLYNGQRATDTRHRIPASPGAQVRPPARPPRRQGVLTSGPPPEPPSPTRAPPRPPASAARPRAAGAGGHPPSAGPARWRHGARTARVPGRQSAPLRGQSSRHRAAFPPPRSGVSGLSCVSPGGGPTKPRPVCAPSRRGAASLPSRPRPRPRLHPYRLRKQHPGARPGPTRVERSTLTVHRARRVQGSGRSFFCPRATENWGSRASPSRSLGAPSC